MVRGRVIRPPDSPDRYIEPDYPPPARNVNAATLEQLAELFAGASRLQLEAVATTAKTSPWPSIESLPPGLRAAESAVAGPPPLGSVIGEGKYRRVHACALGVCKVPIHLKGAKANLIEHDRWQRRHELGLDGWLVPVLACATDGSWLVMQRVERLLEEHRRPPHPDQVRALRDTNANNWGYVDGRPLLLDYGYPEDDP